MERQYLVDRCKSERRIQQLVEFGLLSFRVMLRRGGGDSGSSNQNLIEAWQGTTWSIAPGLRNRFAVTNGIWCASSTFCFAAGSKIVKKPTYYDQTFIAKWNGTRWFRLRSPNPGGSAEFRAITCQGSTYCVAVGDSTPTLGALDTLVEQWAKDQ